MTGRPGRADFTVFAGALGGLLAEITRWSPAVFSKGTNESAAGYADSPEKEPTVLKQVQDAHDTGHDERIISVFLACVHGTQYERHGASKDDLFADNVRREALDSVFAES